jgi:hypothetical protein
VRHPRPPPRHQGIDFINLRQKHFRHF